MCLRVAIHILTLDHYSIPFVGTETPAVYLRVHRERRLHIIKRQKSLQRPDRLRILCEGIRHQITACFYTTVIIHGVLECNRANKLSDL